MEHFPYRPERHLLLQGSAQHQLSVPIRIHGQGVPCRVGAADDLLRDHRFHMGLDVPLQGAGAVDRVIAAVDDGILGCVGDNQFQLFVLQTFAQVGQHQVNDGADFGADYTVVPKISNLRISAP